MARPLTRIEQDYDIVNTNDPSRENRSSKPDSDQQMPKLSADGIYTRDQILAVFRADDKTYYGWLDDGLKVLDTGTTLCFLSGRDVIKFFDEKPPRPRRSGKKTTKKKRTKKQPKGES